MASAPAAPAATGSGGEFEANGFDNSLLHSPRRALHGPRHGSQFRGQSVLHHGEDAPHLDGQYAAFGKVIEGIEEVG